MLNPFFLKITGLTDFQGDRDDFSSVVGLSMPHANIVQTLDDGEFVQITGPLLNRFCVIIVPFNTIPLSFHVTYRHDFNHNFRGQPISLKEVFDTTLLTGTLNSIIIEYSE